MSGYKEGTGKDPLVCPRCENDYEYKGEACFKDGKLQVKVAVCQTAKVVMERMIRDLSGIEETQVCQEKAPKGSTREKERIERSRVEIRQLCLFGV